ncbi:C-terminus of AA_permease [Sediminibacterium ginsengisoli]|uniref:C-terminus of AA_permease n=1 Tax=Sediminibacterium ginsengisoli TaxID=413434 RepID=A0A1T4QYX1_9BACT|nr:C-terminus of AA_permease [Sediminibacterium ginsengisoli]
MVAISWSGYFNNLLAGFNIHLPGWLATNTSNAQSGYEEAVKAIAAGQPLEQLSKHARLGYDAITNAPMIGSWKVILNVPALIIVVLITILAYVGIKESKKSTNFMVIFKIAVILFIIVMGFFYVDTNNWDPFMPNGFGGVLAGVSAVFYAYIGFDAISTTAEECKNPQRDLPRGMIYSLVICTVLYILIALVLTGMVHFSELKVDDPLAYVFDKLGLRKVGYLISVSAVVATTSVLLVFQLGQPRIWMSMSRDGLLPKKFSKVHPRFQTPSFATIVTGCMVGIPAMFVSSSFMTDLTSIGTLFAFVLVCFGVLVLPKINKARNSNAFSLPYINGKFLLPVVVAIVIFVFRSRISNAFANIGTEGYQEILFLVFLAIAIITAILTFLRNYSFIPVIGALCCLYLMIEIPAVSWLWFFVWMVLGLGIYFLYGRNRSRLAQQG